jgi:hypothetical protein
MATESQIARIKQLNALQMGAGLVGLIGGVIYAKRTGGGFWRYVGYSLLGELIVGLPVYAITLPMRNKIIKESESEVKKEVKT